jgi:glycosyltransferase involved in cell wall biosynthesis
MKLSNKKFPIIPHESNRFPCNSVSVLVVCRNALHLLRHTLDSILNQTFSAIQLVIVDGASTDGTPGFLMTLPDKTDDGKCITWISESDSGIYEAMNKAIHLATGEYLWFINAGDQIYSNNTILSLFETIPGMDCYYGPTQLIDSQGILIKTTTVPKRLTPQSMRYGMEISHQSFLVRRQLAPQYLTKYKIVSDHDWIIRCLKYCSTSGRSDLPLSRYLLGGFSEHHFYQCWREKRRVFAAHYSILFRPVFEFKYLVASAKHIVKQFLMSDFLHKQHAHIVK